MRLANVNQSGEEPPVKEDGLREMLAKLLALIEKTIEDKVYITAKMTAHFTISFLEEEYVLRERKRPRYMRRGLHKNITRAHMGELKEVKLGNFFDKPTWLAFELAEMLQWLVEEYKKDPQRILRDQIFGPLLNTFSLSRLKRAFEKYMKASGREIIVPDYLISKAALILLNSKILKLAEKPVKRGRRPETEEPSVSRVVCWYRISDEFRSGLLQRESAKLLKSALSEKNSDSPMGLVEDWKTILSRICSSPPTDIIIRAIREEFKQRRKKLPLFLSEGRPLTRDLLEKLDKSVNSVITIVKVNEKERLRRRKGEK